MSLLKSTTTQLTQSLSGLTLLNSQANLPLHLSTFVFVYCTYTYGTLHYYAFVTVCLSICLCVGEIFVVSWKFEHY